MDPKGGDEGFADGEVDDDEAMEVANVNNESDGKMIGLMSCNYAGDSKYLLRLRHSHTWNEPFHKYELDYQEQNFTNSARSR